MHLRQVPPKVQSFKDEDRVIRSTDRQVLRSYNLANVYVQVRAVTHFPTLRRSHNLKYIHPGSVSSVLARMSQGRARCYREGAGSWLAAAPEREARRVEARYHTEALIRSPGGVAPMPGDAARSPETAGGAVPERGVARGDCWALAAGHYSIQMSLTGLVQAF